MLRFILMYFVAQFKQDQKIYLSLTVDYHKYFCRNRVLWDGRITALQGSRAGCNWTIWESHHPQACIISRYIHTLRTRTVSSENSQQSYKWLV